MGLGTSLSLPSQLPRALPGVPIRVLTHPLCLGFPGAILGSSTWEPGQTRPHGVCRLRWVSDLSPGPQMHLGYRDAHSSAPYCSLASG